MSGTRPDPAQGADDELDEHRQLDEAAVDHVGEVVEVADVVALELEARPHLAELRQDGFDVGEGVAEDRPAAGFQVLLFPVVLPLPLVAADHHVGAEVHRPHVAGAKLRRRGQRPAQPVLDRHEGAAAGGHIQHRVGAIADRGEDPEPDIDVGGGAQGLRIARVQMDDGRAGVGGLDRLLDDRIGRHRQIRRHGRRVRGAGYRAGDDRLGRLCHGRSYSVYSRPPQMLCTWPVIERPVGAQRNMTRSAISSGSTAVFSETARKAMASISS